MGSNPTNRQIQPAQPEAIASSQGLPQYTIVPVEQLLQLQRRTQRYEGVTIEAQSNSEKINSQGWWILKSCFGAAALLVGVSTLVGSCQPKATPPAPIVIEKPIAPSPVAPVVQPSCERWCFGSGG